MANLPPELITDIFSRLPTKSLLRFRCLSKPWCLQIDSRSFAKLHLSRSLKTGANRHLITGFLGIYLVDIETLDRATQFRPPVSASDFSSSVNGIVLIPAAKSETLFLWNPLTGKSHHLPPSPAEKHAPEVAAVFATFGFAFDSGRDDCVVVKVEQLKQTFGDWICSKAMIYSCNSGTWRKTCDFPYTIPYRRRWGVHLNGVLHTATVHGVITGGDRNAASEWSIWGFDVQNERHFTLPKPQPIGRDSDFTVEVLGGCICLVRPRRGSRTDIWIMKEYGVKESWTMLLSVAPPEVESYVICPLAYSEDGQEVLLNHDDKRLIWYHLTKKTVRNACVDGMPFIFYAEVCVASLLHPGPLEADQERHWEGKTLGKISRKKRDDFLSKGFKLVL